MLILGGRLERVVLVLIICVEVLVDNLGLYNRVFYFFCSFCIVNLWEKCIVFFVSVFIVVLVFMKKILVIVNFEY